MERGQGKLILLKKTPFYANLTLLSPSLRLFSHVGDPFLDDTLPREYVLYLRPTGPLAQKLSEFWQQSKQICGKNKAHNIFPHITLCQFFMVNRSSSFCRLYACMHEQPLPGSSWRCCTLHSVAAEGFELRSSGVMTRSVWAW